MKVHAIERFQDEGGRNHQWHTLSLACDDCRAQVGSQYFDGSDWYAELHTLGLIREHGFTRTLRRVKGAVLRVEICPSCATSEAL